MASLSDSLWVLLMHPYSLQYSYMTVWEDNGKVMEPRQVSAKYQDCLEKVVMCWENVKKEGRSKG
jgi:hypothetical protein